MKKAILIVLTLLAALPAGAAEAETGPLTLLLAGGREDNSIRISLSPDGRDYVIRSIVPLEAGGDLCRHPEERPNELLCTATEIAGFEVNVGGGADSVVLASDIPIPATLRGGPGDDRLIGGGVSDKIVGGPGNDVLSGRRGDDWLLGGPGRDRLVGGPGNDQLRGGPEKDVLIDGAGQDEELQ
jgi:Ca2+-binding RTX toxin-like protein